MSRATGQRENGPATCTSSTRSAARMQSRLARPQQRTPHDVDEAETTTRLLEVVAEPRKAISREHAPCSSSMGCRTEFERPANVKITNEEIIAGFNAPHRASWKSRCKYHRGLPEMHLPTLINPILSRELAEQRHKPLFPHRRCGTPTARGGRRKPPIPRSALLSMHATFVHSHYPP